MSDHEAMLVQVVVLAGQGNIDPTLVADTLDINHRYARELLALGVAQGEFIVEEGPDGDEWALTPSRIRALTGRLDTVASDLVKSTSQGERPSKPTKRQERKMTKIQTSEAARNATSCNCACGLDKSRKATFRPGHDARMVSQTAALVVGGSNWTKAVALTPLAFTADELALANGDADIQYRIDETSHAIERHYGAPLARKFWDAAMNGWAKENRVHESALAKTGGEVVVEVTSEPEVMEVAPVKIGEDGSARPVRETVKVGRWDYPVAFVDGVRSRNAKRDGSGEWIAL